MFVTINMTHRSGDFMERVSIYHSVCLTYRWFYNSSVAFNISQIKCKLYLYKFYLFALYLSKNNLSERLNWKNVLKSEKVSVFGSVLFTLMTAALELHELHLMLMFTAWSEMLQRDQSKKMQYQVKFWNGVFQYSISEFHCLFSNLNQMLSFLDPIVYVTEHTLLVIDY